MQLHEFLRCLHGVSAPRTYFEIGVNEGHSLAISRVRTVAVDPAFNITVDIHCDLHLRGTTSDEFFAGAAPFAHFRGVPVDLALLDGLHVFEFALRDFLNTEPHAAWTSVLVFDDVLPRTASEGSRHRRRGAWAGDVFKILPVLQRYRPDLITVPVNTQPTGTLVILGSDPENAKLRESYDEIVDTYGVDSPESIPEAMLMRRCAVDPHALLEAPFWPLLRAAREGEAVDRDVLKASMVHALGLNALPRVADWRPEQGRRGVLPALRDRLVRRVAKAIVASPRVLTRLPVRYRRAIRERAAQPSA